MKIPTFDKNGNSTGYLITCWNANEHPDLRPDQVYVTAIAPHSRKGPHLHIKRRGLFFCIHGMVKVLTRNFNGGEYFGLTLRQGNSFYVSPRIPCALYNYGDTEALVLNMPSPAWSAEDPDDHPVADWKDPDDWPPFDPNFPKASKSIP